MNTQKNKPYVKQYKGTLLVNPITKSNPYLHKLPTASEVKKRIKAINSRDTNLDVNPDAKLYLKMVERRKILIRKELFGGAKTTLLTNKKGKLVTFKKWQEEKLRNAIKNI